MLEGCARCGKAVSVSIMSKFNTDMLCLSCKKDEESCPNYKKASNAELISVQKGDYNFMGIGLAPEDLEFLAARRAIRGNDGQL
jgi:hypothetical protein